MVTNRHKRVYLGRVDKTDPSSMFHPYHVYDVLEPSLTNHIYLRLFPVSLTYQLSDKAPIGDIQRQFPYPLVAWGP